MADSKEQQSLESVTAKKSTEGVSAGKSTEEIAKIKLTDGVEATLEEIETWRKGQMMQSDYTKKTQALAEERRIMDREREEFQSKQEEINKALEVHRGIERDPIGEIQKLQERYERKGIVEPKDPTILAKEDRIRELELESKKLQQEFAQKQQEQAYREMDYKLANVVREFNVNRDELVKYMLDRQLLDPETAVKSFEYDNMKEKLESARKEAVNEYIKKKSKESAPPPIGATGTTGSPPVSEKLPLSLDDAKKAAFARVKNM